MHIRPAVIDDVPGIAAAHVAAWRTAYRDLFPPEFLAGLSIEDRETTWRERFRRNLREEFVFVAESAGTIVGFISGGPERSNDPRYSGEVFGLYLLETFRRRGIGTTLFLRGAEFLAHWGMRSLKVWVLRDNPHRAFYERLGGRLVEERPITIGGVALIESAYGWDASATIRPAWVVRKVRPSDRDEWLRMRHALWPDEPDSGLIEDLHIWLEERIGVAFVAERRDGRLCGFLEVALRPCDVNGRSGPFGYIEGWHVDPDARRSGIGTALVEAAEAWVREGGCTEMHSDALIDNDLSQLAHRSLGYAEVNRLVHFQKRLA